MSENVLVARQDGVFELRGRLTFQTVPQFLTHTAAWLKDNDGAITVDLSNVTLADSAGLALMLEWLQQARTVKRALKFVNLPVQVQQLIRVSGLNRVFGVR